MWPLITHVYTTPPCDMEKFGTLNSGRKTRRQRWWRRGAKQEGYRKLSKGFMQHMKKSNERPNPGAVSMRTRNGAPSRKGECLVNEWSND